MTSQSLIIVGTDRNTQRSASRRAGIAQCRPGDPVTLRREPGTRGGAAVVAVYSERGVQIGYVWPKRADEVAGLLAVARAVFQSPDTFGAVIRVTFDGSTPTLPQPPHRKIRTRPAPEPIDEYCGILTQRMPRSGPSGRSDKPL